LVHFTTNRVKVVGRDFGEISIHTVVCSMCTGYYNNRWGGVAEKLTLRSITSYIIQTYGSKMWSSIQDADKPDSWLCVIHSHSEQSACVNESSAM